MNVRICLMLAGWFMAWYGVHKRDARGSIVTLAGNGIALGALLAMGEELQ